MAEKLTYYEHILIQVNDTLKDIAILCKINDPLYAMITLFKQESMSIYIYIYISVPYLCLLVYVTKFISSLNNMIEQLVIIQLSSNSDQLLNTKP